MIPGRVNGTARGREEVEERCVKEADTVNEQCFMLDQSQNSICTRRVDTGERLI